MVERDRFRSRSDRVFTVRSFARRDAFDQGATDWRRAQDAARERLQCTRDCRPSWTRRRHPRVRSTITSRIKKISRSRWSRLTSPRSTQSSINVWKTPRCAPLERIRAFFGIVQQKYREEGYMGCLMGGLGQELSGVNENFRKAIEGCLSSIAERLSSCLEEARRAGLIAPDSDVRAMADLLVNCWEGAALRSRLRREPSSLGAMLDFYLASITILPTDRKRRRTRLSWALLVLPRADGF